MLLLSCPGSAHRRRASLLQLLPALTALLLGVVSLSSALPAFRRCPRPITCAKQGRTFCEPGSAHCGPCFNELLEDEEGRCVEKRRLQQQVSFYPDLDEEIDFLQSILDKQEVSQTQPPKNPNKRPDAKKTRTDSTKLERKNQTGAQASQSVHAVTEAPDSEVSNTETPVPRVTAAELRGPVLVPKTSNDTTFIIVTSVCVAVGVIALILATFCYVKLQKDSHLAEKVDYPAISRGAGPPPAAANGAPSQPGDKTLAQNAQMYHYQHQKQQMLSMGNHKSEQRAVDSEVTSDEDEVGGDFTVYECPGLAPTGEMEVKNPLFDDSTLVNHK